MIASAFGKSFRARVADIIMPRVALLLPRGDWRARIWVLRHAANSKDDRVLRDGDFMPRVALLLPRGDWRARTWVLRHAANPKDDLVLRDGDFLGSVSTCWSWR